MELWAFVSVYQSFSLFPLFLFPFTLFSIFSECKIIVFCSYLQSQDHGKFVPRLWYQVFLLDEYR